MVFKNGNCEGLATKLLGVGGLRAPAGKSQPLKGKHTGVACVIVHQLPEQAALEP